MTFGEIIVLLIIILALFGGMIFESIPISLLGIGLALIDIKLTIKEK